MKITINGDPATNYFTVMGALNHVNQYLDASVMSDQTTADADMRITVDATEPNEFTCSIQTAHDVHQISDTLYWDGQQWTDENPRHDVSLWDDENLEMMVTAINRNNTNLVDEIWDDVMSVMKYLCLNLGTPTEADRIRYITSLINTLSDH